MVAKSCLCRLSRFQVSRTWLLGALGAVLAAVAMARAQAACYRRPAAARDHPRHRARAGKTYGPIVIKASNITLDGRGAWVIGATQGDPKTYTGVGISGDGVSERDAEECQRQGF